MKSLIYNHTYFIKIFSFVTAFILLLACEKEDMMNPPVVTDVLNYAASPDDTVVHTLNTGQWVVLLGKNLSGVSQVYFGSVSATINNTFFTDESIVVQVPSIPFQSVPPDKLNEIIVVSEGGIATYQVNIVGPPVITHVRNYAASPNDTILTSIIPGQQINLIGYNLKYATSISFQGVGIDLADIIYTDTSAIVQVPDDFSDSDLSQKNRISYTTDLGTGTFSIKIVLPTIEVDPFLELLTGGVGPGKTWVIDFDAAGVSKHFNGPIYFSGDELRWDYECATAGGNCWTWFPDWQNWMPAPADYGTMTFRVDEEGTLVNVVQKVISGSGTFEGSYALNDGAKTLSFADVIPLNMGWTSALWSQAHVLVLTEDALQLGFKHKDKAELEIYNYIPK